jgi:hypothetical protein
MRTRFIPIIAVGITIGFLLGMGVINFMRALVDGEDPKLSLSFTVSVALVAGGPVWYVVKTVP